MYAGEDDIPSDDFTNKSDEQYLPTPSLTYRVYACFFLQNQPSLKKINIIPSPVLALTSLNNLTVYCTLDTGATCSVISERMARRLGLKIYKTRHKAIQVDGESLLNVLGEIYTILKRGSIELSLSALVISNLGTDILCGTDFHKVNDIYSRLATDSIVIKGSIMVPSTSSTISELDRLDVADSTMMNVNTSTSPSSDSRVRLLLL